jgi:hypothetical protein
LIDDPQKTVIEYLQDKTVCFEKAYDFDLMEQGGHLTGYLIQGYECEERIRALEKLAGDEEHPLLFAMGDGNHSLATAKACYEKLKEQLGDAAMNHPARYCLVELVNLHSDALEFEPIHRIVAHTNTDQLMAALKEAGLEEGGTHPQKIEVVRNGAHTLYSFAKESSKLAVGSLQNALDRLVPQIGGEIDYIHGEDVVDELSKKEGSIGFILSNMEKADLFPTVITDGALPRKTFSMGHAHDKRFYMECRRITKE